ncbi:ABC transporter related protein [Pirellula staleyi DSM 6068]|uniref:ABC transporter related protein n=1 Tax=Pirellula staleyi (strain ATCC 27377 / DSM 6068 / ICPB 4128) TaxID=530564 RepID=D2R306_PIRSD|nr:ABC transporter ATP-binding protein [Pirellula staleyi]ADB18739.1 ABC transporter related protein [Pirellula staleyi DSM 6068]
MMPICLSLQHVSKGYGAGIARREVLHDVSLDVRRGEMVAIVGYSGSGKSTLVSLLAGLTQPDVGQVLFDGAAVSEPGPERGVVFQNYSLLPWLSALDNVLLAVSQVTPGKSTADRRDRAMHYLELVNLAHAKDRKPAQLSGGMRQRVALARALAMDPQVLLLDEPLGALDALTRGELQKELQQIFLRENKTIVLITNHVDEALMLADRIVPLSPGPSATLGTSVEVALARPRNLAELAHDPTFVQLRAEITQTLVDSKRKAPSSQQRQGISAPKYQPRQLPARSLRRPSALASS